MVPEQRFQGSRQHGDPVLVPLARPDDHLMPIEVDILDPQPQPLQEPHPGPEKQTSDEASDPPHLVKEPADLPRTQDHRQAPGRLALYDPIEPGQFRPQHPFIQKQQSRLGLVLRGGRDMALQGKIGKEPQVIMQFTNRLPSKAFAGLGNP